VGGRRGERRGWPGRAGEGREAGEEEAEGGYEGGDTGGGGGRGEGGGRGGGRGGRKTEGEKGRTGQEREEGGCRVVE